MERTGSVKFVIKAETQIKLNSYYSVTKSALKK